MKPNDPAPPVPRALHAEARLAAALESERHTAAVLRVAERDYQARLAAATAERDAAVAEAAVLREALNKLGGTAKEVKASNTPEFMEWLQTRIAEAEAVYDSPGRGREMLARLDAALAQRDAARDELGRLSVHHRVLVTSYWAQDLSHCALVDEAKTASAERDAAAADNAALREALEDYMGAVNEGDAHACQGEQGGVWIDMSFSTVQELVAGAEAALASPGPGATLLTRLRAMEAAAEKVRWLLLDDGSSPSVEDCHCAAAMLETALRGGAEGSVER